MELPFSAATAAWFADTFPGPTRAQTEGWSAIASGDHTLIQAPTGSGKTLTAFLHAVDRLHTVPIPGDRTRRTRVVYVSPLKALAHDVERNLRVPLAGITATAEGLGLPPPPTLTVAIRTGDTPSAERRRMLTRPPDILITTPESLHLMLTSAHRTTFGAVETVIVDEIHALAPTKRGAHLAIGLERLAELADADPQRIGLSATQRPLEVTARFLGGGAVTPDGWVPRPVTIVDATSGAPPDLDLDIRVTVDDMANPPPTGDLVDHAERGSIWPSVVASLVDEISAERSTIVFTNARRLAERLSREVDDLAGRSLARAHHGSISRTQRLEIEDALKQGDLPAVVATSTLELGIDMGAVDRVLLVGSPPSVASGLQRVGRAGHQVGTTSRATIYPTHRADLLVATVVADRMRAGEVEEVRLPTNALDVLAQQVVAIVATGDRTVDDLHDLVRRATPFASLPHSLLVTVLDMLAGRFPSDHFSELRPRITWDRSTDVLTARAGSMRLVVSNPGTIPDLGLFRVRLADGTRVGELDEEMVHETRQGDVFLLGSSAWRVTTIDHSSVEVVPAPGAPAARMPFWRGDGPGRPLGIGRAIGAFLDTASRVDPDDLVEHLGAHGLDERAAANLAEHLKDQTAATGVLPTDRTIVVERFLDEIGDWRIVVHSPLGTAVHIPWAMTVDHHLRGTFGRDLDTTWSDDGFMLRVTSGDRLPATLDLFPDPDDVERILVDHLPDTAWFAARFREVAGRSLMLPKRRPGDRSPLWQQRRRAADLLAVARRFPDFPLVLETFREVLTDDFDLSGLRELLTEVAARKVEVVDVETSRPSPFARSLSFAFTAAHLYDGDAPLAERRAAALTVDRQLLAELLGDGELADLLDPDAVLEVVHELQHLDPRRRATDADGVADLLRDLGPLSRDAIIARTDPDMDADAAISALLATTRAVTIDLGGPRLAAVEDVARLRDALGVVPPPGVPDNLLAPVADPLGDIVGRWTRTHGPFRASDIAADLGLTPALAEAAIAGLGDRIVGGGFGGEARAEWCDAHVLRRIKRRTLAVLRGEIEAVPTDRLATFAPAWQGVSPSPRPVPIDAVVLRLLGASIPASVLLRDCIADRTSLDPRALDDLVVGGHVTWVGSGALGGRDGRITLHTSDTLHALGSSTAGPPPGGPLHTVLLEHLTGRGASFFEGLYRAAGGGDPLVVADALWDLVWSGLVTNDTLAPLRSRLTRRSGAGRSASPLSSRFPADTAGRWSLVIAEASDPTTRAATWARLLLDRHGLVTRGVAASEGIPGGFSAIYPALSHLEATSGARRGYFVEGLGGAQFAAPGAVDRLREPATDDVVVVATADPANPFGGAIPWPEGGPRATRAAGSYVALDQGGLAATWEGSRLTLGARVDREASLARELTKVAKRRRRVALESVDGHPITTHPFGEVLTLLGWRPTPRGLRSP